jgi:hypothetical protein
MQNDLTPLVVRYLSGSPSAGRASWPTDRESASPAVGSVQNLSHFDRAPAHAVRGWLIPQAACAHAHNHQDMTL